MLVTILSEVVAPSVSYALTAGPGSPEFSSFEPVATTDMVNVFGGDFTYNLPVLNVPGPDGAGYSMSLSYHSGTNAEEEASWVGYGFTLNPGAINRSVRGFPDEFNGNQVKHYAKSRPNWSVTSQDKLTLELLSSEPGKKAGTVDKKPTGNSLTLSQSLRFNNHNGFYKTLGAGISIAGCLSLSTSFSAQGVTFSPNINVGAILNKIKTKAAKAREAAKKKASTTEAETQKEENSATGTKAEQAAEKTEVQAKKFEFKMKNMNKPDLQGILLSNVYGIFSYNEASRMPVITEYKGFGLFNNFSTQVDPSIIEVGIQAGFSGHFNLQYNKPITHFSAYGYNNPVNSSNFGGDDVPILSDFQLEKDSPYDKRDVFIGMPFANNDVYSLSGEGLSGGFRAFTPGTGHYYPNFIATDIAQLNLGFELGIGLNIDIGLNLGVGSSRFRVKDWGNTGNASNRQFDAGAGVVYRFNNDLGGKAVYADNGLTTASLNVNPDFPAIKGASPTIPTGSVYQYANNQSTADAAKDSMGRSSYINPKGEGFEIYKEDGLRYNYGEAVYAMNETSLSIDIGEGDNVQNRRIAYKNTPVANIAGSFDIPAASMKNYGTVMGEIRNDPYASAYLLTEITTPDYVDADGSGSVSAGDFGGWTKFTYGLCQGLNGDKYTWRIPYTGLDYQKNQLSDVYDDAASLSIGEKQMKFLRSVETKTHIAYFVTNKIDPSGKGMNSNVLRNDGLGAAFGTADVNQGAKDASSRPEMLEKIVLYAKNRMDVPLKIVNFQYSYELVPNVPNNANSAYPGSSSLSNTGKLTLKKVWSQYEGIHNARISPYEFFYNYKDKFDYPAKLTAKYPMLQNFFSLSDQYSRSSQNPAYSKYANDAWGYYQLGGESQESKMRSWPYQGQLSLNDPSSPFDPAAYQLKQIKLPSGGEILIEYEQKDYRYIQDREPLAMVSLSGYSDPGNLVDYSKTPSFKLNTADIGVVSNADKALLADKISEMFAGDDSTRIYFKFLYQLVGESKPSLDDCRSEYISGYARVKSVAYTGGEIIITLDGAGGNNEDDQNYSLTPRQGCYDYYSNQRIGISGEPGCRSVYESEDRRVKQISELPDGSISNNVSSFLQQLKFGKDMIEGMHKDIVNPKYSIPLKKDVCKTLNPELSYLRVPLLNAKRGGGCRVKRLLTYDTGIEGGESGAIYGSVYHYKEVDGKSSGVASNEPSSMREENALVTFIPKKSQSWLSRLIIGQDMEQSEGPLGESLLPGASIGHSRVVVENIHQGASSDGFAVHTFHTVKDYPYDKFYRYSAGNGNVYDFTEAAGVAKTNLADNSDKDNLSIPASVFSYSTSKSWYSQGFRFIQNAMNGQPKGVHKYGGKMSDLEAGNGKAFLSSAQTFEYFEPGEKVQMLKKEGGTVKAIWDTPGKETEVAMFMRSLKDRLMDFQIEIDIGIGLMVTPPVTLSLGPAFTYTEGFNSMHSTTKVIRYPAIQKSTQMYVDGIWSKTDYLAFDYKTGGALLSRSTDIYDDSKDNCYDGSMYSLILPAHWYYNGMGQKSEISSSYALNALTRTNQLSASAGSLITYGATGSPIKNGTLQIPLAAVIDAKAQTFSTGNAQAGWLDNTTLAEYNATGAAAQLNAVYRPWQQWVFKTDVTSINTNQVQSSGIYKNFTGFDYSSQSQATGWIKATEVTKYSPNGYAIEEKDVLGIPSAARYGYNFTMPILSGVNCEYGTVFFEDYENNTSGSNLYAHSGTKSASMLSNTLSLFPSVSITSRLQQSGAMARIWIKSDQELNSSLAASLGGSSVAGKKVARTGDWSLYHFEFRPSDLTTLSGTLPLILNYNKTGETIFVDDARFQPLDSEISCFVYDVATLRLLARFDDQHFGMYYQYNGEGQLVRKITETEKGMKTIQETQYNMPKVRR